jgi:nitroreductase
MDKYGKTDHPIHELLLNRWSPRAFADRPVPRDVLLRLLEAARWAPSSYNEQPWAFLVATKDRPDEFAKLLGCLVEFNQSWAKAAPVLMLTVAHNTFTRNGKPNRHAFHDVGLAIAQLTVQATAEGLYVHQMAGIDRDKARTEYGIPADWEAVAGGAVGYLGDADALPEPLKTRENEEPTRKPLAEFVFGGAWGSRATVVS